MLKPARFFALAKLNAVFQEIAAIVECSIIEVGDIDRGAIFLSKEISESWTRLGLKHKQQPFLLRLYGDAEPVLTDIE